MNGIFVCKRCEMCHTSIALCFKCAQWQHIRYRKHTHNSRCHSICNLHDRSLANNGHGSLVTTQIHGLSMDANGWNKVFRVPRARGNTTILQYANEIFCFGWPNAHRTTVIKTANHETPTGKFLWRYIGAQRPLHSTYCSTGRRSIFSLSSGECCLWPTVLPNFLWWGCLRI